MANNLSKNIGQAIDLLKNTAVMLYNTSTSKEWLNHPVIDALLSLLGFNPTLNMPSSERKIFLPMEQWVEKTDETLVLWYQQEADGVPASEREPLNPHQQHIVDTDKRLEKRMAETRKRAKTEPRSSYIIDVIAIAEAYHQI